MATGITREALRAAVPPLDGTLTLAGLERPVDVLRDRLGVPHIRAATLRDAFFAQGFVHAQDPLWQMEFDRRRATGRWAEYVGPSGVEQDALMRRLGIAEAARRDYAALNDETREVLDAYAAGVNAFIGIAPVLPIEYRIVGGEPEPWEPWHSSAVFCVRHILMGSLGQKLWRLRLLKTVGAAWIGRLRAGSGEDAPLVVPPGLTYEDVPDAFDAPPALCELLLGAGELGGGSNNWAVHGSRTASGKPLLAGDPHRAIDVPNVYYQNGLACPDFHAVGYSFAGLPGFPHFGHTEHVAWGVTHATADYQDVYVERFAPGDPTRYEFRGAWRPAERRRETIRVRGADPVQIDATVTHHGPVFLGDPADGYALALRYTATAEPNRSFESLLPMLRARTVAELDESMRPWVDPGNNFVMADTAGTIGYLTRGRVPIRARANAWLPVPGWTGEHEWQGAVPFEEMPRARDPEQGFIATANQRIVGPDFPHYISLDWAPPHRAQRVNARLRSLVEATAEEMEAIHRDIESLVSAAFIDLASDVEPADAASRVARDRLLAWDGVMAPDSAAAAIYATWREWVTALVLEGPALAPLAAAAGRWEALSSAAMPLAQRLRDPLANLLRQRDGAALPPGETWATLGARALARACAWLADRLGPDQAGWRWDAVHRTRPRHPLSGAFPELAELLDPPSVGVGGDGDTPQNGTYGTGGVSGDFFITVTSVTRYCFDLGDWERSGWVVPLGASGHPGSDHYADQVEAWASQRLDPIPFARERVDAAAVTRQRLEPDA